MISRKKSINGAFNLGVMLSGFVFGMIADHWGQRPMFALASLMPLTACSLFYFCAEDVKRIS